MIILYTIKNLKHNLIYNCRLYKIHLTIPNKELKI